MFLEGLNSWKVCFRRPEQEERHAIRGPKLRERCVITRHEQEERHDLGGPELGERHITGRPEQEKRHAKGPEQEKGLLLNGLNIRKAMLFEYLNWRNSCY